MTDDTMKGRASRPDPPAQLPVAQTLNLPAIKAAFTDGTDGKPRLVWAKYSAPPWGFSGGAGNPYVLTMGGRTARDQGPASAVASDLSTSNPLLATILENLVTNAVGTGLTLSAKPDAAVIGITEDEARALSHEIETRWNAWARNPLETDLAGRHDLHQLAAAAFTSYLIHGEAVATLDWRHFPGAMTRTKVALLDPAQLDRTVTRVEGGQHVLNGVAFRDGRVAGYYLRDLPLGNMSAAPIATFHAAHTSWGRQRVIHLFDLKDMRQVRGLSPLVAALTPAHERENLSEFTLANALLQSQFALTVESDLPPEAAMDGLAVSDVQSGVSTFERSLKERGDFYTNAKITPQPGVINHLMPGDKLKFNAVQNPSHTFADYDRSLTRKAARAGGDSYENVSGDYSQTNFSASRMAAEQPHRLNVRRREAIVVPFYRAVYAAWLEEQLETGAIRLPRNAAPFWWAKEAYVAAKFIGLGRFQPDPKKAAEADILALVNNLETLEDVLAERGKDLETHVAQIASERKLLAKYGLTFAGLSVQANPEPDDDETPPAPAPTPAPTPAPNKNRNIKR